MKKLAMNALIDRLQMDGFVAYQVENHPETARYEGRDGYHKIALISGMGEIKYDRHIHKVNGSVLVVTKPGISCTWSLSYMSSPVYVCVYNEDFINTSCFSFSKKCDELFSSSAVFNLNSEQETFVRSLFSQMIGENNRSYPFKEDLRQNQLCVLTHLALRMVPLTKAVSESSCPSPLAAVYLELIEIGFPPSGQALHFN